MKNIKNKLKCPGLSQEDTAGTSTSSGFNSVFKLLGSTKGIAGFCSIGITGPINSEQVARICK